MKSRVPSKIKIKSNQHVEADLQNIQASVTEINGQVSHQLQLELHQSQWATQMSRETTPHL